MDEKLLYINLFQPIAQYRNPFTFFNAQTFPLPPKSTIIGMLQNLTGEYYNEKYDDNIKMFIGGRYGSIYWNYLHKIKGTPKIRNGRLIGGNDNLPLYGNTKTSQRTPVRMQEILIADLEIILKINDSKLHQKIKNSLEKPKKVVYLGRGEDSVFIRSVNEAKIEEEIKHMRIVFNIGCWIKSDNIKKKKFPVYYVPTKHWFEKGNENRATLEDILGKTHVIRKAEFKRLAYIGEEEIVRFNKEIKMYSILTSKGKKIYLTEDNFI